MKKLLILILFLLLQYSYIQAQNNVGIGTNTPNTYAILELFTNNKGLLIPRMTTVERLAITSMGSNEEALLVYDLTKKNFYYWDGTQWLTISSYWRSDNGIDMYSDLPGNVGIGVNLPSSTFHVNGSIRFEGLNTSNENNVLTRDNLGNLAYRNIPNDIWDGDNQTLSFSSPNLTIQNGNTVDLSSLLDNTDNQQISLNGNIISLTNGGNINLTPFLDNTDNQQISFDNSIRTLFIQNGNNVVIPDLDNQTLSLASNTLSISNGNTVSLAQYLDNTDNQTLSLNGNAISLTNGGSIDLTPFLDNTDNQTLTFNSTTRDLSILNGNTVNIPDKDEQTLTYDVTTGDLTISNGNTVQIRSSDDDWVINHPVIYNNTDQVAIGTSTPHSSAIFQVNSTSQGMLFPTMTTAQRDAISNPAVGLSIFNATTSTHQYWNGTCWLNIGQTKCTDFSIALTNANGCIYTSQSSKFTTDLNATLNNFDAIPILLGVSGVPSGVSVAFSSNPITPTATSQITFTGSPSATPGSYVVNVLAINGGDIISVPFTLQVVGFTYNVSANALTLNEINVAPNTTTGSINISIAYNGTCPGGGTTATFSLTGVPPGVTGVFSQNPLSGNGNTTLTFTSNSCAVVGVYNVVLVADIGGTQLTTPIALTIAKSIINITANANNYNLYTAAGTPPCPIDLDCNISAGVVIGATSTANIAFSTGAFASGSVVTINNAGTIAGAGGNGGDRTGNSGIPVTCPNADGKPGGLALSIDMESPIINNTGIIGGGGGGGGKGGDVSPVNLCLWSKDGAAGGGGAGSIIGLGGTDSDCNVGQNGTLTNGGAGGAQCDRTCSILFITRTQRAGFGGAGGNLGQAGQRGQDARCEGLCDVAVCGPGNGGAAGVAIARNTHQLSPASNLGDVRGAVTP